MGEGMPGAARWPNTALTTRSVSQVGGGAEEADASAVVDRNTSCDDEVDNVSSSNAESVAPEEDVNDDDDDANDGSDVIFFRMTSSW